MHRIPKFCILSTAQYNIHMKTILVIEDHEEIRENVMEMLELSGYQVIACDGGNQGLEEAKHTIPDLILCDIAMPQTDGFEVLRGIKTTPCTSNIPFIFLTAKSEKSDIQQGLKLGADDYLVKPFDQSELLAAINMQLRKKMPA